MRLQSLETVNSISGKDFREYFFKPGIPLVIRDLSKRWPAYAAWNWNYFKQQVGDKRIGIYNNTKSEPHTPVDKADAYVKLSEYIDMLQNGPAEWRVFLFNIFHHAPKLVQDFMWPDHLVNSFVKRVPMLFMGGQGSVTPLHYDMDLSHIMHTQFGGHKRVLLFPPHEQDKLYRKPFEVMSFVDFSRYYDAQHSKVNEQKFPALKNVKGYEVILGHGDTLFMPGGWWHHTEYVESGFALSLRALHPSLSSKLTGLWNLAGMRTIDTLMKKNFTTTWHNWKEKRAHARASKYLEESDEDCAGFTGPFHLLWNKEN